MCFCNGSFIHGSYSPKRELFALVAAQEGEEEEQPERNPRHERHPDDVLQDELTANVVGEETEAQATRRRARNAAKVERHRRLAANLPIMNLDHTFEAVQSHQHRTPLATIASIDLITRAMSYSLAVVGNKVSLPPHACT